MKIKNLTSWSSLGILALLFLALVMLSNVLLRGVRMDLTENKLYTLSDGSINILSNIEEPIQLRMFFADESSRDFPMLRSYYQRVREMLLEFEERSGGRVEVSFIDPKPFSEDEDLAARYGVQAVPVGNAGDSLYFGLAGTNAVDSVELIPFFHPDRERFLEYDLIKLVYRLNNPTLPRLGVLSTIQLEGGFDINQQANTPEYTIYTQLGQFYEVVPVQPDELMLPPDLDALLVVHPKHIVPSLMYAIDQFVLSGGRLLAFVDPFSDADRAAQMPGVAAPDGGSDLPELFSAWGVEYNKNEFVGDLRFALEVGLGAQGSARHVAVLGLTPEAMSAEDVVTASLSSVNLASAGHFTLSEDSQLQLEPLLSSSENAALFPVFRLQNLFNPTELLQGFQPTGDIYHLAVRLKGAITTAYPDGAPEGLAINDHIAQGELNAVIIGDSEMLNDAYWVQRQNFFGQVLASPFAGNGDLVMNAAENLLGDADLISVRPRDVATRPFTRVDRLRVEAEQQFRATEQQLEQELTETENTINRLQEARGDADLSVLSDEQQAEVDRFLERKLEIRKELRQVRRNLDRNIERLGVLLKAINILFVPALVTIASLFYFNRRRRRQQAGAA